MKSIIIARNKFHLENLIQSEIQENENQCDLNHIDVSQVTDMSNLFAHSRFNGDISKWNTSNVKNMSGMFFESKFNGNISNWDVSKVEDMQSMFDSSHFNSDISKWDVSNVLDMQYMFSCSAFNKDLSEWKPYRLELVNYIFDGCNAPIPYWVQYDNLKRREIAINTYILNKELNNKSGNYTRNKIKI